MQSDQLSRSLLAGHLCRQLRPSGLHDAVLSPDSLGATSRLADSSILLPACCVDIGPRVIEVKADRPMANLPEPHARMVQPLSKLTIESTVDQPFVKAIHPQDILSPD